MVLLMPLGLIISSWYKYSMGIFINTVFSPESLSIKIGALYIVVSFKSSKEYTSSSPTILNLNENLGKTIVLVTHEPDIAEYTKRILRFKDGKIIEDIRRKW